MTEAQTATIRVVATATGTYDDVLRGPGDVFDLHDRKGTFTEVVRDQAGEVKQAHHWPHSPVTKEVTKTLTADEQFNPRWMKRVEDDTPVTTHAASAPKAGRHTVPEGAAPRRSVQEL